MDDLIFYLLWILYFIGSWKALEWCRKVSKDD